MAPESYGTGVLIRKDTKMESRGRASKQWRDAAERSPHSQLGPPNTPILDSEPPEVEARPFLGLEPTQFGALC